ncbi:MAG: hypothetical protein K6F46_05625 [Desulfovibrio sp.]|nr:hypothetical protein [Desulfovibrio sp.]
MDHVSAYLFAGLIETCLEAFEKAYMEACDMPPHAAAPQQLVSLFFRSFFKHGVSRSCLCTVSGGLKKDIPTFRPGQVFLSAEIRPA